MKFVSGVLSRDMHSGWKIGETPLLVHRDCTIYMDGAEEGWLEEGREASSWDRLGETISAISIRMTDPMFESNEPEFPAGDHGTRGKPRLR